MREKVGDQELPVSKWSVFDLKHPMFVGVHPDFEQKSEGSKYQNSMTLVNMVIEKYQCNIMVAIETDDLDNSSFSRNMFFLVETQTMEMDSQI